MTHPSESFSYVPVEATCEKGFEQVRCQLVEALTNSFDNPSNSNFFSFQLPDQSTTPEGSDNEVLITRQGAFGDPVERPNKPVRSSAAELDDWF